MYGLGIDIGYASAKIALVDENAVVLYSDYRLHRGDIIGVVRQFIDEMAGSFDLSKIEYAAPPGNSGDRFGPGGIKGIIFQLQIQSRYLLLQKRSGTGRTIAVHGDFDTRLVFFTQPGNVFGTLG